MNEDFLTREAHIMQIDYCTKKFVQTYCETECADCYNECNHSNEKLFTCIAAHFSDYIIVDENNPHNKIERMTEKKQFKDALINCNKAVQNLDEAKKSFEADVVAFMKERGISVSVGFFRDTFGLDICYKEIDGRNIRQKIPLDVLTDFCKAFGCEYEYTNCDGKRYLFSFDKLKMW